MTTVTPKEKPEIDHTIDTNVGIIAWFSRNSVAANLLMIFILVGGLLTIQTLSLIHI